MGTTRRGPRLPASEKEEANVMFTLDRRTPLRELDRVERRMRRLLEERGLFVVEAPAADIYETDREYVVELEVPGFNQD